MTSHLVTVIERAGREICTVCGGDPDGTPCRGCGGCGTLPFSLPLCPCGRELHRNGSHLTDEGGRLPRFYCHAIPGHVVAIRFMPVEERRAA